MKNIYYILGLFFVFSSCDQVINVEIPDHEPQIVLSCFYKAGETRITARLTQSVSILTSDDSLKHIIGATINLYEDDVLNNTLTDPFPNQPYVADLNAPLQTGKIYRIEVIKEGFETVWATQTMPPAISITDFSYEFEGGRDLEGIERDEVEFKFQDPPSIDNYYQVVVREFDQIDTTLNWGTWTWSLDPIMEEGWEAPVFNDDLLDGENYNLRLLSGPAYTIDQKIGLEFSAITKDKYLLSKSLVAQGNAIDNPFAEPVIVYSNVVNGQGIFSMESRTFTIIK